MAALQQLAMGGTQFSAEGTAGWGWDWAQQAGSGWNWQQQQQQTETAAEDQLTIDYNHGSQQRRPVRHRLPDTDFNWYLRWPAWPLVCLSVITQYRLSKLTGLLWTLSRLSTTFIQPHTFTVFDSVW